MPAVGVKMRLAAVAALEFMKTQHTPGPWHYADPFRLLQNSKGRGELWMRGIGNGSVHVGYSSITPATGSKEALANAQLIAAAPELLEACKAILECDTASEDMGGDWGTTEWCEWVGQAITQARAAIAKATGESPGPHSEIAPG